MQTKGYYDELKKIERLRFRRMIMLPSTPVGTEQETGRPGPPAIRKEKVPAR